MKQPVGVLLLVFLLLLTNLTSSSEAYVGEQSQNPVNESLNQPEQLQGSDKEENLTKEDKKVTVNLTYILLLEGEKIIEEKQLEVEGTGINLEEFIHESQAFASHDALKNSGVRYLGFRNKEGELVEETGEICLDVLEEKKGQFILILEYEVKKEESPQETEKKEEMKHLFVPGHQALYQMELAPSSARTGMNSGASLRAAGSRNVSVIPINPSGSWAFLHVWDKTKDPITGVTSTFAYFRLDDNSIGFCMHPGLKAPQGDLPVDIFANSAFRSFAEKVATLAISSGGIPGYSFEENFVFAQMYIWKKIPFSGGSQNRYEVDFRYQHSPFEQHKETTQRYLTWKSQIDSKINSLGQISFDGQSLEMELGKEYRIEDKNKQLKNFNIISNQEGLEVKKEGNTLILKANKPLEKKLEFWQARGDYPLPEITFVLRGLDNSYQDLAVFRDPFVARLDVKASMAPGKVKIIKKDEAGNRIPGAVFEISEVKDFSVILQELTTGSDGGALSKDYALDKYPKLYLREKSVPEPYIRSLEIREINLKAGMTREEVFVNAIKKVSLSKSDFATGKALAGAVIELTDPLGKKKEYTTDSRGRVEIVGLSTGSYSFREIVSPQGYILNKESFTFAVDKDGQLSGITKFSNKPTKLKILKSDNNDNPIKDAGFEVYFYKDEGIGEQVLADYNGHYGAYTANSAGGESIFYSDDRGCVEIDYLARGQYLVKEVKAAPGFKLGIDGSGVEKIVSICEKGLTSREQLHFINFPTEVVLRKTDLLSNKGVAGATIEVRGEDGVSKSFVTDENGLVKIRGLKAGIYQFKEMMAPRGYVLGQESFTFTIDEAGVVSGVREFSNEPTHLSIIKKDKTSGKPLAGAGFEVYFLGGDRDGQLVRAIYDKELSRYIASEQGETMLISDEKGEIILDYLPQGEYFVIEKKAVAGYKLPKEALENRKNIVIDDNSNQSAQAVLFLNEPTEVILRKKDMLTGEVLMGAEIELIHEGKKTKYISDEKGQIKLIGLKAGTYTFKEKKQPSGYILEKETFVFFLDEGGDSSGVKEFVNEPTRLILEKVDELGRVMEDVEFELVNSEGKTIEADYNKKTEIYTMREEGEIKSFITGKEGKICIDYLPEGEYSLRELRTRQGYCPIKDMKFLLENHGVNSPLVIKIVNKKELPKTGQRNNRPLLFIVNCLILFGLFIQRKAMIK